MIVTGLPRDLKHIIYNNILHFSDTVNFSNKILRSNNRKHSVSAYFSLFYRHILPLSPIVYVLKIT